MTVELKKDETVFTTTLHVSKSGMTRHIKFFVIRDNSPLYLTNTIIEKLGYKPNKHWDSIVVRGCGMDMGYHVVHNLSFALFGEGYSEASRKRVRRGIVNGRIKAIQDGSRFFIPRSEIAKMGGDIGQETDKLDA